MLEPFTPLLVRTKPLRFVMLCLGMGSHFTTIMILESNSGSITTSSCLTHAPDGDRAAPVFFVGRRYRLRVGLASREAFFCRWRWCFVGDGAVWMGVYFALLGMEGEKQAPLLATTTKKLGVQRRRLLLIGIASAAQTHTNTEHRAAPEPPSRAADRPPS